MSSEHPTENVLKEDWPKMLAYLPIFRRCGPTKAVKGWIKTVCNTSFYTNPYQEAPDGEDAFKHATDFLHSISNVESLSVASLDEIRWYMVLCCRAERFCDGFISAEFSCGNVVAA